ncbi:MAG: glycosyl hydrolase [Caldisericia bacterium]|nr:glycosyl hydrolase [Caldisericia bacterium]
MKQVHFFCTIIVILVALSLMSCEYKDYINGSHHFGVNYVYHSMQREAKQTGISETEYISRQNKKLDDLGVGWIRSAGHGDLTSLHWATVEKEEGVFDFRLHDARVRDAQDYFLSVLGTVDFSVVPDFAKEAGKHCNEEKYLRYLHAVVERYDGDGIDDMEGLLLPIKFWEIGNETLNKQMFDGTSVDYAKMLQISYQSIKENDPESFVLIGGWVTGANSSEKFQQSLSEFEAVLQNNGGQYFDVMNFHNYTDNCDFRMYEHVEGFKNVLAKYGFTKPMWITETNTKTHKERKNGKIIEHLLEQQSQDIIKRFVTAFDAGVDVVFWHGLDDSGENNPGVGFFDEEGIPKPIYYNLNYMIENIDTFKIVERLPMTSQDYAYRFQTMNNIVIVAWTEQDKNVSLDLSGLIEEKFVNISYAITKEGQSALQTELTPVNQIKLSKTPLFITIPCETCDCS